MESYWLESTKENRKTFPKLERNKKADVCIIGGGLTGITIAYYLSKAKMKVVLLEKKTLCCNTTGNSTAKITSQHGLFYDYLINSQGEEKAKEYLEANEAAIKNIEEIIKKEKIECEFQKADNYIFTREEKEIPKIKKEVEAVKSLGFPAEFVTNVNLPLDKILGAIKFPNQAKFNPVKYALELVNAMPEVQIFENTKVVELKNKENKYEVITDEGKMVEAKYVVISSHYPIINVPGYYFLKMYQEMSYVIGLEADEFKLDGMYINSEKPTISVRTTKMDNGKTLLIIAGMDHKTGEGKDLSKNYEKLEEIAKKIAPNSKIKYKWATEDTISLDKIPYIGEFSSLMPNVYVGTGYKKWGITTSNVAANIIVDKILERKNPYEEVFTSTRLKPIKNREEMGNMVKEVVKGLVVDKLKLPKGKVDNIKENQAKIIDYEGVKLGIYKDENR